MELLKVYDTVNKNTVELDEKGLIDIMIAGRQVDVFLKENKTDPDGYMTWNERLLSEYTGHNIHDLYNEFKPYEAVKVELS